VDGERARLGSSGWLDKADGGSTTALAVGDFGARSSAANGLLAGRTARHLVVALNIGVLVRRDLKGSEREARLVLVGATNGRTAAGRDGSSNAVASEALVHGALGV